MADSLGTLAKAAFIKERGLYGAGPAISYPDTPGGSDLGAGDQIFFTSESLAKAKTRAQDTALIGAQSIPDSPVVAEPVSGAISDNLHYNTWQRIICLALGFEHPDDSPVHLGATPAYAHIFEGDDDLQDRAWLADEIGLYVPAADDRVVRRGLIGVKKQVSDWVYNSCFVNKLTISGNPQEVTISADLVPYDQARGSYNSGAWTLPSGGIKAMAIFPHLEIKLGLRSGGEVGLVTVRPSAFEFVVDNKLKGDDQSTESGVHIEQPLRDSHREVSLKLEMPRYSSDTETIYAQSDLEMAAKLEFTGAVISGAYSWYHGIFMSSLRWRQLAAPVAGAGRLARSLDFVAEKPVTTDIFAAGNYNGVTLVKDSSVVYKVVNLDTVNYLTEV